MKKLLFAFSAALVATAGLAYTTETLPNGDTLIKFTTAGADSWQPPRDYERATILIVGGGGGGGRGCGAAGGGAGEVMIISNQTLLASTAYTVTVGAGGAAGTSNAGGTGGDSSFGEWTAPGGGGGGGDSSGYYVGLAGANGGGGCARGSSAGGAGTGKTHAESAGDITYYGGFAGGKGDVGNWNSGGGGGALGVGLTGSGIKGCGGNGGDGIALDITGTVVTYACGGGGGANGNYSAGVVGGSGGSGGVSGGNGSDGSRGPSAGAANTGAGGGAGSYSGEKGTQSGAAGGSGVVYVRIPADQPAWKATGYAHSCTFSVVGYRGSETLVDFPLLVRVKEGTGGFSYSQLLSDGLDIRFTLADDTILPYEVDTFDTTGTSCFWVKVPALTNGLNLKMHWGKADDYRPGAKEVFADYVGVYHLGEETGDLADSSPLGVAATRQTSGDNTPFQAAGRIGKGTCISDSKETGNVSNGGIYIPSTGIVKMPSSTVFTLSAWICQNGAVGGSDGRDEGLFMTSGDVFICRRHWGNGNNISCGSEAIKASFFNGKKVEWLSLTLVYSGTACTVYKNGVRAATLTGSPALNAALAVGCRYRDTPDMTFRGSFDEVRIRGSQLSADWVGAEFDMASTRTKFLSFDEVTPMYVVPAGTPGVTPTAPYATWATAATDLSTVVNANIYCSDVKVAPGRYPISARLNLNNAGTTYSCVDPATGANVFGGAVIDGGSKTWTQAAVVLTGASIRGFTFANVTNTVNAAEGAGLYVSEDANKAHFIADTVFTNCVVTGSNHASGGGAYLANGYFGTLTNCLFVANQAPDGGGLFSKNTTASPKVNYPTVVDTTFVGNKVYADWGVAGAAYVGGTMLTNCLFTGNGVRTGSSYSPTIDSKGDNQILGCRFVKNSSYTAPSGGSAIYGGAGSDDIRNCLFTGNGNDAVSAGRIESCIVTNNSGRGVSGNIVRNCLIANNGGIGVYLTGNDTTNRIENCTIVNNGSYGIQANSSSGTAHQRTVIANSVLTGNKTYDYATWRTDSDYIVSNAVIRAIYQSGHDASQDTDRWTYTVEQCKFTDAALGDYSIKRKSPCVDKGLLLGWMTAESKDVAGNPRVMKGGKTLAQDPSALPDLGCYENGEKIPGMLLLFR